MPCDRETCAFSHQKPSSYYLHAGHTKWGQLAVHVQDCAITFREKVLKPFFLCVCVCVCVSGTTRLNMQNKM